MYSLFNFEQGFYIMVSVISQYAEVAKPGQRRRT